MNITTIGISNNKLSANNSKNYSHVSISDNEQTELDKIIILVHTSILHSRTKRTMVIS